MKKSSKKVCCGILEQLNIKWMVASDGVRCLPFIYGKDQIKYRVNHCPSCGAYVRDSTIKH